MCEGHEANYIRSEDYQNQDSHNSFSRQSHYDRNDSEKSLTELNNDVKNDLEDFKRCVQQTDRTNPPPPLQAHTEHVNAVFTGSGKSDDSPKIQKDPPPIIVNKKLENVTPPNGALTEYMSGGILKTGEGISFGIDLYDPRVDEIVSSSHELLVIESHKLSPSPSASL
ncbi:hypothetical protein Tco_0053486 [Tanacetum coccineum]